VILTGLAGVDQITLGQSEKGKGTYSRLVRFRKRTLLPPTAPQGAAEAWSAEAVSPKGRRNSAETIPAPKRLRACSDQRKFLGLEKVLAQLAFPKKNSLEIKRLLLGFVS
jgi:hypothetical protein